MSPIRNVDPLKVALLLAIVFAVLLGLHTSELQLHCHAANPCGRARSVRRSLRGANVPRPHVESCFPDECVVRRVASPACQRCSGSGVAPVGAAAAAAAPSASALGRRRCVW